MATIRPIQSEDKQAWLRLWSDPNESYLKFYKSLDVVDNETSEFTFSRFLDPEVSMYACVAEYEGEIIGFANYLTHLNTWTKEDTLYLNDLYVLPTNRLKGVGKQLIEFVYAQADKLNCPNCYWQTQFENHRAQLLYTKVGKKAGFLVYSRP